jgi:hypothetical protein
VRSSGFLCQLTFPLPIGWMSRRARRTAFRGRHTTIEMQAGYAPIERSASRRSEPVRSTSLRLEHVRHTSYFVTKPARSRPRRASALFMNVFHTKPVRRFSAINIVMPVSIAITSVSYQPVRGLNAFTNP